MMLVLLNVIIEPLNVRKKKKKKETLECDKSMITCYVGIVQCDDETVKCE